MPRRLERGGRLRHGGVFGADDVGQGLGPPTYTAKGPTEAPQLLTGSFVAVANAIVTTAPFTAQQKAIITTSVQLNAGAGVQDTAALQIFDGVATVGIDSFQQTVGNQAEEIAEFETVSWTTEVVGNGLARTFGLAVEENVPGDISVPPNGCRIVVQIVDG